MDAKSKIVENLGSILAKQDISAEVELEPTATTEHGDYSSNIALKLSKNLKKNPQEIAQDLVQSYKKLNDHNIEKIEVAGPGFINFWIAKDVLMGNLDSICKKKDKYGHGDLFSGKKVMVEFTDPNPLKEFHIGHLYSNAVGESLSRLFEAQNAEVWRVCYQGDVGLHVAKAIYGIQLKIKNEKLTIEDLATEKLSVRSKFLGEAYVLGAKSYEVDAEAKKEIESLNIRIYHKDPSIFPLYETAKGWSLEYFETLYLKLGTRFKRYYFELEAGEAGLDIVKKHIGDVFQEDNGSVIFPKEKSGLHTRVFINSQGLPTYEAKELGLAPAKYKDFPYDISVIVTGNEINEYFKVLLKALSLIEPDLAAKTKHVSHGMVRLPTGKMSSRTGEVITGDWLLNETEDKIKKEFEKVDEKTLGKIGVASVKYAMLKSNIGGDISFSFDESISINGNSGPYLQYTYVRTQSVLEKAQSAYNKEINESAVNLEKEEEELLRTLIHYPEVVLSASENYSPNLLCNYLFDLSQKFNLFYQKHKIMENPFRLQLTEAVGQVLKNGLHILGIETVGKM